MPMTAAAPAAPSGGSERIDQDAAREYLGTPGKPVSRQMLWRLRMRDEDDDPLPHYRVGRRVQYSRSELDAWMRREAKREIERRKGDTQ